MMDYSNALSVVEFVVGVLVAVLIILKYREN